MKVARTLRFSMIAMALSGVAACADGYGGVGYGNVGYASGYSGEVGFGGDYYGGFGYPGYGLYNDYYYPGYGSVVFGRDGRRRGWNDGERAHWAHRGAFRGNHLYEGRRFDAGRDRGYMADRGAAFRNFRSGTGARSSGIGSTGHGGGGDGGRGGAGRGGGHGGGRRD